VEWNASNIPCGKPGSHQLWMLPDSKTRSTAIIIDFETMHWLLSWNEQPILIRAPERAEG